MAIESLPKLNFSVPFAMTAALPVEYNAYFDDYDKAVAAAATAEAAGSSNTVYYYGQKIVVVTQSSADLYIIQPDKTLAHIGTGGGAGEDKTFVFTQAIPADVWLIEHNLNKYPSVSVVDTGGNLICGDVEYVDINTVRCKFSSMFSGNAYLN